VGLVVPVGFVEADGLGGVVGPEGLVEPAGLVWSVALGGLVGTPAPLARHSKPQSAAGAHLSPGTQHSLNCTKGRPGAPMHLTPESWHLALLGGLSGNLVPPLHTLPQLPESSTHCPPPQHGIHATAGRPGAPTHFSPSGWQTPAPPPPAAGATVAPPDPPLPSSVALPVQRAP
jgi:hypothetical protein